MQCGGSGSSVTDGKSRKKIERAASLFPDLKKIDDDMAVIAELTR
jgi:hypothetical protein